MPQNEEPVDISQLNLGQANRNAGRDYYEMFIPGSIKLLLATQPRECVFQPSVTTHFS